MEMPGDESEADQNVLQSEELCKTVPGSATIPSDEESGGECSSTGNVMNEGACEENRKNNVNGKYVQNVKHDGENVLSESGHEDKLDDSETYLEKLDSGKENENGSDDDSDISESVREVTGTFSATQDAKGDVIKNKKDSSTRNTVDVSNESNVNTSESEVFGNEENNHNMSSEGSENDISLYLSSSDAEVNESEKNEIINSSDMKDDENEDSQTLSSFGTEGSENENIHTVSISTEESNEKEDVSQSTISSGSQIVSSENEENNQTISSSDMESIESDDDNPDGLESDREDEDNKIEVENEISSEVECTTTFPDLEKDNINGNEEDIQKSNRVRTEAESELEIKQNANRHGTNKEPEHLTEKMQGAEESRPKDTQDDTKRSLEDREEKTLNSDNSIQDAEGSEVQEQGSKIMTDEKEKETETEIEAKRKEEKEKVQSEVIPEQEEMEEQAGSREVTVQEKVKENETPIDVTKGKVCEDEQREKEGIHSGVQVINPVEDDDKTQKSVNEEPRQPNVVDGPIEKSDINKNTDYIKVGNNDEVNKDAHDLSQPNVNEELQKLTCEVKSKQQQNEADRNSEVTLSEDLSNQTGENANQSERLNETEDLLPQTDEPRVADKEVSEKDRSTSQKLNLEEPSLNQDETIGSEVQVNKEIDIREKLVENEEATMQEYTSTNHTVKESEHLGQSVHTPSECSDATKGTSSISSEMAEGSGDSSNDDSRTMKHKDTPSSVTACKKKLSDSNDTELIIEKEAPPGRQNIAKKSTGKRKPVRAAHLRQQPSTSKAQVRKLDKTRQQPSTSKALVTEQDAEDSDDSDIIVLSESIKAPVNVTISGMIPRVCRACQCLWNDDVLDAIFDGNKSVTVNSKITYGAIMCFSSYADVHYAQNKETAVRNVLERAELGKNIGNIKIKEILEWLRYLMNSGSVSCCKVFDVVYNPKSASVVMSRLLSEKENAKQNSKTPKKQSSYSDKRKYKAAAFSRTTTTTTASAKNINQSRQIEAKQVKDTTAKKVLPDTSCTDVKKCKVNLKENNSDSNKKRIRYRSGTLSTTLKDDLQSLNKKFVLKECSVYLGKPVQRPSTPQRECSVSRSTTKSIGSKRRLTEEMDEVAQSTKKGRVSRHSLTHKELTESNKSSESDVKNAIDLSVNDNSTADLATDFDHAVSSNDLDEETNMDTSENKESLTEQSSDLVPTRTSKQSADKKSMSKLEEITAKPNEDVVEKSPTTEENDKQEKGKTIARHVNKNMKRSSRTEKIEKANIKDTDQIQDTDQILAQKSEAAIDDSVGNMLKPQEHSKNVNRHDIESTKSTNKNKELEETIVKDADVEHRDRREPSEETKKVDTETEKCDKNENVNVNLDEEEIERHDKNYEIKEMNKEEAKAERHEKHDESEDMEDGETEKPKKSENVNMKDTDVERHDKNMKTGVAGMSDAAQTVTEVVSTDESIQSTIEEENICEKVKKHGKKNIKLSSENIKCYAANIRDREEETVTEKHDASTDASTRNGLSNQVKRSAETSTTQSTKKQKPSDELREQTSGDTKTEDLTQVKSISSKLRRRTRSRNGSEHLCSTDSNNSENSMSASFEHMESSPLGQQTPNFESSNENSCEARSLSPQKKTEEKMLKSPKTLRSRSRRTLSQKLASYSETSDSNDQLIFTDDSVPKTRTGTDYQSVPSTEISQESENILVQKLGLNVSAIELYCNTTDVRMPTNRDVAKNLQHKDRSNGAVQAMLKERSNLDGVAKEAFDLLPFEQNNVICTGNNKERYLTNQELLVLQNICVLNPEAPDVDMFYQILIQVLLARRRVLLVPNSLALLVVAEKVRREFNRAKRKGNHGVYLAQDWDPCKIYTTEDFWLADKKPPRVPTVRTVLSMFCLWKNLEKRFPISLPIALEELCRNLVLGDVDKIGICVKLYSRYCTFLYEEKNSSLAEIFLNQPFIGSKTQLQKKKLLYSKADTSGNDSSRHTMKVTENDVHGSLKHTMKVTENDVQALLKQCLEAEQAALLCPHPKEEENFRKCVQALKYQIDAYKKEIQLIQKVTKDTEKKKFQLFSKFNSPEYEDLPQELGKTTENLYRLLAKRTTKFEMLKEAECLAAKETDKVSRLSPTVLKAADLGEDVSNSMKELVYELLLSEVKLEEIGPVLCTIVENITNENQSVVPSNSWIRNFARITGLKVKPHASVVH